MNLENFFYSFQVHSCSSWNAHVAPLTVSGLKTLTAGPVSTGAESRSVETRQLRAVVLHVLRSQRPYTGEGEEVGEEFCHRAPRPPSGSPVNIVVVISTTVASVVLKSTPTIIPRFDSDAARLIRVATAR